MIQQFHFWMYDLKQGLKEVFVLMFIAELFTIAKMWKYPHCPLMDE